VIMIGRDEPRTGRTSGSTAQWDIWFVITATVHRRFHRTPLVQGLSKKCHGSATADENGSSNETDAMTGVYIAMMYANHYHTEGFCVSAVHDM
jgi:hypothetical protein